jgi:hypothetical protein
MQRMENKLWDQIARIGQKQQIRLLGARSPRLDQSIALLNKQIPGTAQKLDRAQKTVAKSASKYALSKLVAVVFVVKDLSELIAQRNAEMDAS